LLCLIYITPQSLVYKIPEYMGDATVGSVGDSYDNALAETTNGLYRVEVIRCRGEAVEKYQRR